MNGPRRNFFDFNGIAATAVALAMVFGLAPVAAWAGDDDVKIVRKGKVKIVHEDDDGDRHEQTFEFDGDSPRPFLGVMAEKADGGGARIERVVERSSAESAGLEAGDVIVRFGETKIEGPWDLTRAVLTSEPGRSVDIDVIRDGREQTFTTELGQREDWGGAFSFDFDGEGINEHVEKMLGHLGQGDFEFEMPGRFNRWIHAAGRPVLGVQLAQTTPELREHLGGTADAGVLVSKLIADMPAEQAGIKVGDLIVAVDGIRIADAGELIEALRERSGESVDLDVIRDRRSMTIRVSLPDTDRPEEYDGPRA